MAFDASVAHLTDWFDSLTKYHDAREKQQPSTAGTEENYGLIEICKMIADGHWNGKNPDNSDLLQTPFVDRAQRSPDNARAKMRVAKLMNAYQKAKDELTEDLPVVLPDETVNSEIQMYIHLGIWLGAYWLGVPIFESWDTIFRLSNRARRNGVFPGGAFYDKLGGDVYRHEIRQQEKHRNHKLRDFDPEKPLIVMAHSPLILVPDEDDVLIEHPELEGMVPDEIRTSLFRYMSEVETLACRYLRVQAWRYFSKNEYPVWYAISQKSVTRALWNIATKQAKEKSSGAIPTADAIMMQMNQLKRESNARLKTFFPEPLTEIRDVIVLDHNATQGKGLTSCILGQRDGVTANRPNRPGEPTSFCEWIEGTKLYIERRKIMEVWTSKEGVRYKLSEIGHDDFADIWCTQDVINEVKEEYLNENATR